MRRLVPVNYQSVRFLSVWDDQITIKQYYKPIILINTGKLIRGVVASSKLLWWYRDGGARTKNLAIDFWEYLFWHSPLVPLLKTILGTTLHEQLGRFPNLGYWPQIREPRSFNEKVLHRMLFTDEEIYSVVADKWAVRSYVERKVGDEVLNEVYHVTDDPETIPFDELPDQFVIRATHGSGWNIIVENKHEEDFELIKSRCSEWLSKDFSARYKEYWYSNIEPKLIVERYIRDPKRSVLLDFCFFVFHGRVEYVKVDFNHVSPQTNVIYDRNWNPQTFRHVRPLGTGIDEPERLHDMINIAETLGEDFDFIRIDLYAPDSDEIYFGEMTLSPYAGGGPFFPTEYDFEVGSHW